MDDPLWGAQLRSDRLLCTSSPAESRPLQMPEEPSVFTASILSQLKGDDRILHVSVLVLAGIAVLASVGFACVLVAFLRQKRFVLHPFMQFFTTLLNLCFPKTSTTSFFRSIQVHSFISCFLLYSFVNYTLAYCSFHP